MSTSEMSRRAHHRVRVVLALMASFVLPARAPLAIVMHGYFEYSGYGQMYALIRHGAQGKPRHLTAPP